MDKKFYLIGIVVDDRCKHACDVQEILTRNGSKILTRLGVHDPDEDMSIITLNVKADQEFVEQLVSQLASIDGVNVKKIELF
ncbi:MAG: hypothetical protein PHP06_08875 [Clostridia bacterium]|nr:hypothetical protein [Clostridia bacterium]